MNLKPVVVDLGDAKATRVEISSIGCLPSLIVTWAILALICAGGSIAKAIDRNTAAMEHACACKPEGDD